MYCPKCNQNFEERSRRFCPTDGARLIENETASSTPPKGGIFANLIPKMGGIDDLGGRPTGGASSVGPESSAPDRPELNKESEPTDLFFELDDADAVEDEIRPSVEPQTTDALPPYSSDNPFIPPPPRKIDLDSVPEGRIDLETGYQAPDILSEFDTENPEFLVGQVVKGRYKVREFLEGD